MTRVTFLAQLNRKQAWNAMTNGSPAHLLHLSPGASLLGREWVGFDEATRSATLRFEAKPEFANRHGAVMGGFLAAMLDSATGLCLLAELPPDRTAVTTDLTTSFVRPASLGILTALARIVTRNERDAIVEAELRDTKGQVVARATATLRILPRT